MNPVLKRFLKGFGAYLLGTLITAFFTYTLHWLQINPMVFGSSTGIIATLLLTGEKAIPQNM